MEFKMHVDKAWYEVTDHLDRDDVILLLKVVLNNCVFSIPGRVLQTITQDCNGVSMLTSSGKHVWSILRRELLTHSYKTPATPALGKWMMS